MSSDTGAAALPPLYHINAVVKDIDKTMEFLSLIWGLGPWQVMEFTIDKDDLLVGEPCSIKLAGAKLGPTILELIQPVVGRSIWSEFLETNGEGLHHIAFSVPNWDEMVSKLQEQGGRMVAGGFVDKKTGMRWCYFDTKPGGIVLEFEEKVEGRGPVLSFEP